MLYFAYSTKWWILPRSSLFVIEEAKEEVESPTERKKKRKLQNQQVMKPSTGLQPDQRSIREPNGYDSHVVETLRGSLFVSLACVGTEASQIATFAQDTLRRL
jgi:hypothetical protein